MQISVVKCKLCGELGVEVDDVRASEHPHTADSDPLFRCHYEDPKMATATRAVDGLQQRVVELEAVNQVLESGQQVFVEERAAERRMEVKRLTELQQRIGELEAELAGLRGACMCKPPETDCSVITVPEGFTIRSSKPTPSDVRAEVETEHMARNPRWVL